LALQVILVFFSEVTRCILKLDRSTKNVEASALEHVINAQHFSDK